MTGKTHVSVSFIAMRKRGNKKKISKRDKKKWISRTKKIKAYLTEPESDLTWCFCLTDLYRIALITRLLNSSKTT